MLAASFERPVYLLKHSASCLISARGRRAFLKLADMDSLDLYMVVVQQARDVSTYLADVLNVRHETPQAILIRDGEALSTSSHFSITPDALREAARTALA